MNELWPGMEVGSHGVRCMVYLRKTLEMKIVGLDGRGKLILRLDKWVVGGTM